MTLANLLFSLRSPSVGTRMSVLVMTTVIQGIVRHKFSAEKCGSVKQNKGTGSSQIIGMQYGAHVFYYVCFTEVNQYYIILITPITGKLNAFSILISSKPVTLWILKKHFDCTYH